MRIEAAGRTHVGMIRDHNEDALLMLPQDRLFVVADGMGGHASGEVASALAVTSIEDFFRQTGPAGDSTWPGSSTELPQEAARLVAAIQLANSRILERSADDASLRGMGTTLAAVLLDGTRAFVGWAGDSRVYRLRQGQLTQLSQDHSLLNDYIRLRNPSAEEIAVFPHKHVIVRALGLKAEVAVDVVEDICQPADVYLVCSDGLSGMVEDDRIADIVGNSENLERAVDQLIDAANAAGGSDNVTVLLVRCLD